MMAQAKKVLSEAERLNNLAGDISKTIRGPLSLGCMLTFAQVILPSLRAGFEAKYPEVICTQAELDQAELFSQLRRAEIDVALTYALAERSSVEVNELLEHPMVLLDLPFSADYFLSFFQQAKVRPNIAERTRDIAVMRSLVANGFGYSIANLRPLNDLSPDGKPLRFVPIAGDLRAMKVGLLTAQDAENVNVIRAFVDHCRQANDDGSIVGLRSISTTGLRPPDANLQGNLKP